MKNKATQLKDWLNRIENSELPDYENIPDVNLYMDQVVKYINDSLMPFSKKEQKAITSYMINNYVKDKLIEAPKNRTYSKEQTAYLIAIAMLKSVISMDDLSFAINKNLVAIRTKELYKFFKNYESEAFKSNHHIAKVQIETIDRRFKDEFKRAKNNPQTEERLNKSMNMQLSYVALKFYVEAQVKLFFAQYILDTIKTNDKGEN